MEGAHYSPPWTDTSIIGIAGSSGSGKTSLAVEIVSSLNLPWVVILSMDSFYKVLTPEQHALAHRNEYDLDSPSAMDFDLLVERLRDLKAGRRADIPLYSFAEHQRQKGTTAIYSPHVLILEGIYALHDPRVLELLDMKIFAEADADVCLARRILRDVKERGRDIEGCIKQWIAFVKPNFEKHVEPQRKVADIIIPRSKKNRVAINMILGRIQEILLEKSNRHRDDLEKLGQVAEDEALSPNVLVLEKTNQLIGMNTILQNPDTTRVEFIFQFDRLSALLVGRAMEVVNYAPATIQTPKGSTYKGLSMTGTVSAVIILRGGSCLETGLKRVIPDCKTGRMLVQTNFRTGEPELHFLDLPDDISTHEGVLLLDPEMSSGGAALMAVRVLVDHGVPEDKVVFVTYFAGKLGLNRLMKVFPAVKVVIVSVVDDAENRWMEEKYLGC